MDRGNEDASSCYAAADEEEEKLATAIPNDDRRRAATESQMPRFPMDCPYRYQLRPMSISHTDREAEEVQQWREKVDDERFYFFNPEWMKNLFPPLTESPLMTKRAKKEDDDSRLLVRSSSCPERPSSFLIEQHSSRGRHEHESTTMSSPAPHVPRRDKAASYYEAWRQTQELLYEYQRYVEQHILPQMEQMEAQTVAAVAQSSQLRRDNETLVRELQFLQRNECNPAHSTISCRPSRRGTGAATPECDQLEEETPLSSAATAGAISDCRDAKAEALLLRQKLDEYEGGRGTQKSGNSPCCCRDEEGLDSCQNTGDEWGTAHEAVRRMQMLADDGTGFAAAMRRAPSETVAAENMRFRTVEGEWTRLSAQLQQHFDLPTSREANVLLSSVESLSHALQHERSAVAATMHDLRQHTAELMASVAECHRSAAVSEETTDRRFKAMEADHDAEVQTLEQAMVELERQLRQCAATRRPWTAGLLHSASPIFLTDESRHGVAIPWGGGTTANRDGLSCRVNSQCDEGNEDDGGGAVPRRYAAETKRERTDTGVQTLLSLELLSSMVAKASEEPLRYVRREKETDLIELMLTEVERLQQQLTDSTTLVARLKTQQQGFIRDISAPTSIFDAVSAVSPLY